ncbi:MAG TPA: serine/threonine-protein kinase [Solirubrobacterales bacterium]|nr:serine/threonine-protein kinase [Solirubrobacterales bacterium]
MATIGTGELLKDRYRLERTLGRGGMAAVWLGHDEVLDRPVAVKVLADTIASDPDFVTRFRREATTVAGLSHPNLAGVYDFSEEGERPYLVMQLVPGENLAARLERGESIDRGKLARELLEALDHIHRAGILHRDVKPANVILEPDGTAKLIDFGIARPRDATALTSTGLVLGTERYAAPEVMEGRPASERSDLYSLGVLLRACPGDGAAGLDGLIEWLADLDPDNRPASARQALARLERVDEVRDAPTQAYRPAPERSPAAPERRSAVLDRPSTARHASGARRGALLALLAFAAALVAVVALVFAGGGEEGGGGGGTKQAGGSSPSPKSAGESGEGSGGGAEDTGGKAESEEGGDGGEAESATTAAPAPAPAPEGTDPEAAAALNQQGYELIQAGEYAAAVPVLEEAVAAFPAGTEDLDYAYALFNLGSALRLGGRPEDAIPVLEERLQIPNQTGTVEEELAAARAEAG